MDSYIVDCSYTFICLNDAPDTASGEMNYLNICDILTGKNNCYESILAATEENNFVHIKVPQTIHKKDRENHSSLRHTENLNWFNQNIDTLFPTYKDYDYICHIDSDAFLVKPIHLVAELSGYDMAGPLIYINATQYYIHTGLFFINLKTVTNMKDIKWDNTMGTDTGSDIVNFISNNPQYKIKSLGHYNGYSVNNAIPNGHTIIELVMPENIIKDMKLIDIWFDKHFIHFRSGSCFGPGSLINRSENRLHAFNMKYQAFLKLR
jgi:hypothetical protein